MEIKKIALVAGGYSGEYDVSLNSANNIYNNIDNQLFKFYKIIISRKSWFYESEGGKHIEVDKNDFSVTISGEKIKFDAAFITVHGTPGEDGKLQGYFDLLNIPYNTCDSTTSAITMNKAYTKAIVKHIDDLHVAASVQLFAKNKTQHLNQIGHLNLPVFIKPNSGGSSVGMSKVSDWDDLPAALEKAFAEDEQVLVEEFIKGREFSIGIVSLKGETKVLPVTEIISSKDFFDYEAKYTPGISKEITPADLSTAQNELITGIVKQIYQLLNCRGMVRIDFILQENTNHFYFIEVNTTPGQSANSLIPQQVRATGMQLSNFYGALIEESLKY
jgi:D-alanine-D-alanine ligase